MDKESLFRFLKPTVGRILLFLFFCVAALINWQVMAQPGLLWVLLFGLPSLVLFLPLFLTMFFLERGSILWVIWILIPVYWYLLACAVVVLDKKIRDRRFGRCRK